MKIEKGAIWEQNREIYHKESKYWVDSNFLNLETYSFEREETFVN